MDKKWENVTKPHTLGWTIAATLTVFFPLGVVAITKAVQAKQLWKRVAYEQAEKISTIADILALCTIGISFLTYLLLPLLLNLSIWNGASLIILLLFVLFGIIGSLERRHRTCGFTGDFILGMFGIIGWIMVYTFSWKGEDRDAWLLEPSRYI